MSLSAVDTNSIKSPTPAASPRGIPAQDLMQLFNKIKKECAKDGLKWSENCKLVDVAFGVKKIVCTAVINQTLSMDAIIEEITEETFVDEVQSMSMTSMSLL